MMLQMLKAKVQELQVTESNINYMGSISIPSDIMDAAGIRQFEMVYVNNKTNGNRIITYAVRNKNNGCVTLNGAASKLFRKGDSIHVLAYVYLNEEEAAGFEPVIVIADKNNQMVECKSYVFD